MSKRSNRDVFREEMEANETINVSPLIDVVFILLIFFIVTTVFVRDTGIEVERPQAATSQDLSAESILFAIDADGRIHYGGSSIELRMVRGLVQRLQRESAQPVILQADRATRTEDLVRLMDEVKQGGAASVHIATLRE